MDIIKVRIPAAPEFVHVVRLVAAGLASRIGFTIDDIEDLKIAVDELTSYLTGPHGREGTLEIKFSVTDDRIEISGLGEISGDAKVRTELTEFSRQILSTVADEAALHQDGVPSFRLVKTRRS
jgi:serine/threonine-protein kinase RsbW